MLSLLAALAATMVWVCTPVVKAQDKAKPERELSEAQIKNLIEQLGADEYEAREEATMKLIELGEKVVPYLEQATKSDDPEIAWRCRRILRAIKKKVFRSQQEKQPSDGGVQSRVLSESEVKIIQRVNDTRLEFSKTRDGKVTVKITEKKDGRTVTEEYSANSVREFKEKYPEVARRYGIEETPGGGVSVGIRSGARRFTELAKREFDKLLEDLLGKPETKPLPGPDISEIERWWLRWEQQLKRELQRWFVEDFWREFEKDLWRDFEPEEEEEQRFEETTVRRGEVPDFGAGVEFVDPALRSQLSIPGEEGVVVNNVIPGSLSDRAGVKKWDVILRVDGQSVRTKWELWRLINQAWKEGKNNFTLDIIRKGQRQKLVVKFD
jgi:hypothetical protein